MSKSAKVKTRSTKINSKSSKYHEPDKGAGLLRWILSAQNDPENLKGQLIEAQKTIKFLEQKLDQARFEWKKQFCEYLRDPEFCQMVLDMVSAATHRR